MTTGRPGRGKEDEGRTVPLPRTGLWVTLAILLAVVIGATVLIMRFTSVATEVKTELDRLPNRPSGVVDDLLAAEPEDYRLAIATCAGDATGFRAAGTVTNLTGTERGFLVHVDFLGAGSTRLAGGSDVVLEVPASGTVDWTVTAEGPGGSARPSCSPSIPRS